MNDLNGIYLNAMNILDRNVSFFENCRETMNPVTGSFLAIVTSQKLAVKFGKLIEQIRATTDKEKRTKLKKQLPTFTPSGTFQERNKEGLLEHSGLIAFDIDPDQNPFLNCETAPIVRDNLMRIKQVAYCALSASGKGVWGVIPIEQPEHHSAHFEAIKADFAGWDYVIDKSCGDVCRARFWSYDPNAKSRTDAQPYSKLIFPAPQRPISPQSYSPTDSDQFAHEAAKYLIQARPNLECTYNFYLKMMFACHAAFGHEGKDIAWDILASCTTFLQSNTCKNFEKHWKGIKDKPGGIGAGTLVKIALDYGMPKGAAHSTPHSPTFHEPAHSTPTARNSRQSFTDKTTGEKFEVVLCPDGYPAAWDLEPPQREALARTIQANPATKELIGRFALQFDRLEPIRKEAENA